MKTAKRGFSPERKQEVAALLGSSGQAQMQVAAELGMQSSWLEELADDPER